MRLLLASFEGAVFIVLGRFPGAPVDIGEAGVRAGNAGVSEKLHRHVPGNTCERGRDASASISAVGHKLWRSLCRRCEVRQHQCHQEQGPHSVMLHVHADTDGANGEHDDADVCKARHDGQQLQRGTTIVINAVVEGSVGYCATVQTHTRYNFAKEFSKPLFTFRRYQLGNWCIPRPCKNIDTVFTSDSVHG